MAVNLDYQLDPYGAEAAQLAQRQRLAQMMIGQGINDQPVYSDKAGIAKMLTAVLGQVDSARLGNAQIALAKQRQADERSEMDRIIAAATGQSSTNPAVAGPASGAQVPGGGPPVSMAPAGVPGSDANAPAPNSRFALAQIMARSSNPQLAQAGLGMILKGPDAPIVKETAEGLVVLSPDGMHVLNKVGGAKITPPNVADVTPESLAKYQQSGNPADLVPRIKQQTVDTGNGTMFVNPESPPSGVIPKSMTPGEAATTGMRAAELRDQGVAVPGAPGGPAPSGDMPTAPGGNVVSPQTQAARDQQRMQILLGERQRLAANGTTDPALETEIADMQRRGFGQGAAPAQGNNGLSPKDQRAVAASTQQGLAKGGVDYKIGLDTRVQSGADLMMRINEAQKALSQFQPGMGAETRLQLARAAQMMGAGPKTVEAINNGDLSAKQEFMKLSAQQAMESLKQAMGGTGRITQAEFKVFQANNPNIELDPNAIGKIFDFSRRVFMRDQAEQQGLTNFLQNGGNISQWPTVWTQQQLKAGLMDMKDGPQPGSPDHVEALLDKYAPRGQ